MDPHVPDSGLDGERPDDAPTVKQQPGLTPAGSLMSIQIRRRTPPKARPSVPPAAAMPAPPPAAEAPKPQPAVPAPPVLAKPVAPKPTAIPRPAPQPAADPTPVPAAAQAPPAGRAPSQQPTLARVPAVDTDEAARRQLIAKAPPAVTVRQIQAAPASPPAPPAPTSRSSLMAPGITRHARAGEAAGGAQSKATLDIPTSPARPSTMAIKHPGDAPAPPAAPRAEPAAKPEQPVRPEGIVSYWLRLRGHRRYPSKTDLDQGRIAADWPNSILIRCRSGSKALEPEKVFTSPNKPAGAAPGSDSQAAMEISPMMLQWLLTLAGDAARDRRPMQDTEAFPARNQSIRYGAIALPFSDDQKHVDHVLCHVYRAP